MVVDAEGKGAFVVLRVSDDGSDGNFPVIQRVVRVASKHVRGKQRLRRARNGDRFKEVTRQKCRVGKVGARRNRDCAQQHRNRPQTFANFGSRGRRLRAARLRLRIIYLRKVFANRPRDFILLVLVFPHLAPLLSCYQLPLVPRAIR